MKYRMIETEAEALKVVEKDGDALQYVREQTEAVCLKAVEENGDALCYVRSREIFEKLAARKEAA